MVRPPRGDNRVSSPSIPLHGSRRGPPAGVVPVGSRGALRVKRWMDLLIGSALVIALAPLLALVGVAIRLDSPGPVFFRQTRIGRGGRPFAMLKFRSMVEGAPEDPHRNLVVAQVRAAAEDGDVEWSAAPRQIFKLVGDPRITRVGRWLRRTSLDELPQLFNVLRGDMSLVGPRPPLPYEYEAYAPWHRERLAMPQGMTGLWQVSGRSRLSYRQMIELDIEYVRTWSLWLDLKVLARTPRAVFTHAEPAA